MNKNNFDHVVRARLTAHDFAQPAKNSFLKTVWGKLCATKR